MADASDQAKLAEAVAEHRSPVLSWRALLTDRRPLRVVQRTAECGDLFRAEADVGCEDAATHDLAAWKGAGQRARAIVVSENIVARDWTERNWIARCGGEVAEAV